VGGNVTKDGPDPLRPTRSRPHWWVVLAVSLSLLALVAATTAEHDNPSRARAGAGALSSVGRDGTRSTPHSPPVSTTSTTGVPLPSTPTVTSPTSPSAVETDNLHEDAPESPSSSATTTTTTITTPATSSTTTTAPAAATEPPTAPTETKGGSLQQPNLATASYPFSASGAMQVSATWTPAATTLSLTVTCNAVTQGAQEGSSPLTVSLPDADGPCEATLKETVVEYDAVPYSLTIGPAQGG